jgi:hypothetical protein
MQFNIKADHIAALLSLMVGVCTYLMMGRFHVSEKMRLGTGILSVLVFAIFWSIISLGTNDDEE